MARNFANKGAVLLITLLLMISLSTLGVVAVNQSVRQIRIANSFGEAAKTLTYAEAAINEARNKIYDAADPRMLGYTCADAQTSNYWPSKYSYDNGIGARYCITMVAHDTLTVDPSGTSGGPSSQTVTSTYYYRLDAYVERRNSLNQSIVTRQIQTLEAVSKVE